MIWLIMDKYDILSKMAAQDGRQSKNDLDHVIRTVELLSNVTRDVELPLTARSPV